MDRRTRLLYGTALLPCLRIPLFLAIRGTFEGAAPGTAPEKAADLARDPSRPPGLLSAPFQILWDG